MASSSYVPILRFSDFEDDWQLKELGDLVIRIQSGLSRKLAANDIGIPVIRSNNLQNRTIDVSDLSYWYVKDPQGANTSNYILHDGDLLINFINSQAQIGKFALYEDKLGRDAIFTTNIMRLSFTEKIDPNFICLSLSSKKYTDYIQTITKPAVNQASFTTVDIKKYRIFIPTKKEQQKIANFFTIVDEKIANIDKKVKLMKSYKKSVMQKILTQEIQFQYEDGVNYPMWKEKKLRDVAKFVNGFTFLSSTYVNKSKYKVITIANVQLGRLDTERINTVPNLPPNIQENQVLKQGDLLISMTGNVGRVCVVNIDNCLLNQRVGKIVSFDIMPQFLYINLNRESFTSEMSNLGQGGAQDNLSSKDIMGYDLKIPSQGEQRKIADFIGAIDDKINIEKQKLIDTKKFKKVLMQRMFV